MVFCVKQYLCEGEYKVKFAPVAKYPEDNPPVENPYDKKQWLRFLSDVRLPNGKPLPRRKGKYHYSYEVYRFGGGRVKKLPIFPGQDPRKPFRKNKKGEEIPVRPSLPVAKFGMLYEVGE